MRIRTSCFDPLAIEASGQSFRMRALEGRAVEAVAFGQRVVVTPLGRGCFDFDCTPAAFASVWQPYFDLAGDYPAMMAAAPGSDRFLQRAIRCGRGLRILRQEPWETLVSFIISQRKNIPAIRACVEALCDRYGEAVPGTERRAFPTAERLAGLTEAELRACALGYRAPYVLDAARRAAEGRLDWAALSALPDDELRARLLEVSGVGVKVAECTMLFGFHRLASAPVDVWIQRVIAEEYGGCSPFEAYGTYAGVYQQYLFEWKRQKGKG